MSDTRTITNLEAVEALLEKRLDEVGYLAISERVEGREEQLARLEVPAIQNYQLGSRDWSPQVATLMAQLREELLGMASGRACNYRVGLYDPSGRRLTLRTCVIRDESAPAAPSAGRVEEVVAEVQVQGVFQVGAAWREFTDTVMAQTREFGAMCLKQMKAVDEISREQAAQTAQETAAARQQVNTLVAEVTKTKTAAAEAHVKLLAAEEMGKVEAEKKALEAKNSEVTQALAKDAVSQLGELGRAFFVSKTGLSPEMAEVSSALQGSPEMMEALKDPAIIEQLKDPANLASLAGLLKQTAEVAAQQAAEAAEEAGDGPDNPGESGGSPTT